jgi:hypothetical protein
MCEAVFIDIGDFSYPSLGTCGKASSALISLVMRDGDDHEQPGLHAEASWRRSEGKGYPALLQLL